MKENEIKQKLIELGAWENYKKEYERQRDEDDPTSAIKYLESREKWSIIEGETSIDDDFYGFYQTILLSFNWDESEKGEEYWEKIAETYPSNEILEERKEQEIKNGNRLIAEFFGYDLNDSYPDFRDFWHGLMPVVGKITKIIEQSEVAEDLSGLQAALLHNDVETVWEEVVRIIQFIQSKNN